MNYFNNLGRRIPSEEMRVFGREPSLYYRLKQPSVEYPLILERTVQFGALQCSISALDFQSKAEAILDELKSNPDYVDLLKGVHIPFVFQMSKQKFDLGENLENTLLPHLQKSFNACYPEAHFKAVLQSQSELPGNISLAPGVGYEAFISASEHAPVVGWYFPQALQEFDVRSQRAQMSSLPKLQSSNLCLSGGMDVCAALIGSPDLLISEEFYTPILCMSSYVHKDPRLVLLLKAYGPHMEFWCMTQMLTPTLTQVSEQWAGGLTVFR